MAITASSLVRDAQTFQRRVAKLQKQRDKALAQVTANQATVSQIDKVLSQINPDILGNVSRVRRSRTAKAVSSGRQGRGANRTLILEALKGRKTITSDEADALFTGKGVKTAA